MLKDNQDMNMKRKRGYLSVLLLAVVILLQGCSREYSLETPPTPPTPPVDQQEGPEIMLWVDAESPVVDEENAPDISTAPGTRAPLDYFRNTDARFAACFVPKTDFRQPSSDSLNFTTHWNARISVAGQVVFVPQRSYTANEDYIYLRGFHPQPAGAPPQQGMGQLAVDYTLTGQEDVMISTTTMVGNIFNPQLDTYVKFSHMLTRFTFNIVTDVNAPYPGENTVKAIWVEARDTGQQLLDIATLNLRTGGISFSDSGIYPDAKRRMYAYQGAGLDENSPPINRGGVNDATYIAAVMFEPGKAVDIHVLYGDDDIKVFSATKVPQQHTTYDMTLYFSGAGLTISQTTINAWVTGTYSGGNHTTW
jgi:hypothetical protein